MCEILIYRLVKKLIIQIRKQLAVLLIKKKKRKTRHNILMSLWKAYIYAKKNYKVPEQLYYMLPRKAFQSSLRKTPATAVCETTNIVTSHFADTHREGIALRCAYTAA